MTKSINFRKFTEVDEVLSSFGHGCGTLHPMAVKMVDENGLRPGEPWVMKGVVNSAFSDAGEDEHGRPVFGSSDYNLDDCEYDPLVFGYLAGKETYPEFNIVPWMGIASKNGQPGMVDELDGCDFFGDSCAEVSEVHAQVAETNRFYSYEPVSMVSSKSFKDVNDAGKRFEQNFQHFAKGEVLVAGSGSNTLCSTFDFSNAHVTYVDESQSNLNEIVRRFAELGVRPKSYVLRCGDLFSILDKHYIQKFSLIIANNSLHHILKGDYGNQKKYLKKLLKTLQPGGALVGFGPSISGLSATPYTQEVRRKHGLYGFTVGEEGPVALSHLGGTQIKEPLFFSTLLYSMEEICDGRAEICHLSSFSSAQSDADLVRCYEAFSFVSGKTRPTGVVVKSVWESKSPDINFVAGYGLDVQGRSAKPVTVIKTEESDREVADGRTYGVLIRSQHTPNLLYQGPYLVSKKIDGKLGELSYEEGSWSLYTEGIKRSVDVPKFKKLKNGTHRSYKYVVEVLEVDEKLYLYWLETLHCQGRPFSWLGGLRSDLPSCVGVKHYKNVSVKSFIECLMKDEPSEVKFRYDGIVLLNPHDRAGGFKPKHLFFKPRLSVDVELNGKVYEVFRDKGVLREDHEANGSLRMFEAPFLLNQRVIVALLTERMRRLSTNVGEHEFHTLDEVLSYPSLCGTLLKTRSRNTALVQLWRGMWEMEDKNLVGMLVPLARHQDWGLFGVIADCVIAGGMHDKDGLLHPVDSTLTREQIKEELKYEAEAWSVRAMVDGGFTDIV